MIKITHLYHFVKPDKKFSLHFFVRDKKALFPIWGDDAGKLFYLPLPAHVGNIALFYSAFC